MSGGFYSNKVRSTSYTVANEYVNSGKVPCSYIAELCAGENTEFISRVCEMTNQQIYLALFHKPGTNKAAIKFPTATLSGVLAELKRQETPMSINDYNEAPVDYRASSVKVASYELDTSIEASNEKRMVLQKIASAKSKLELLRASMETMKVASERDAEACAEQMHRYCRNMVLSGDGFGDIAKVACRAVAESGLGHDKVAAAIDFVGQSIAQEGIKINDEFTKVSSAPVQLNSPMNKSAINYAIAIEKVAGLNDVIAGIDNHIKHVESVYAKAESL